MPDTLNAPLGAATKIDPARFEVVKNALISTARR